MPTSLSHPGRLIRLMDPANPYIYPQRGVPTPALFEPFSLPCFPLSQSCWLTGLANFFYASHQRGLAVLLVLDLRGPHWTSPMLPSQRCTAQGASFQLLEKDLDAMPAQLRIAGSFQSTTTSDIEEASDLVPPFDGLHVIHPLFQGDQRTYCFLRIDGRTGAVNPRSILIDDWMLYLQERRDRLSLD